MKVVETFAAVRAAGAGVMGLCPTHRLLHAGHLARVRRARAECDTVVVSRFADPLELGAASAADPTRLDHDGAQAEEAGADVLFAPPVEEMYPEVPSTRVTVEALTLGMEGVHRPGRLDGAATVFAKLLAGIQPQRAYLGRRDAQRLAVLRRLVRDLSFPVEVVPCPTVRSPDGLALSSGATTLSAPDRAAAGSLATALEAAARLVEAGERRVPDIEQAAFGVLSEADGVAVEYVALADADETVHLLRLDRPAFLVVAAVVGGAPLIDSYWFTPDGDEFAIDRGTRLDGPPHTQGDD